ncbi:MAG: cob(I)yrinic acid a,c-diamide adenosyltransferase [Phycisphaerales bacterium]|nr:cob(I)yrinic acid a,c-diamide adenosyltransferase [Phycisphaerales bacterium]
MRLYTKRGDGWQTGLIGGTRVSKDHPRVAAYGDVDELNAVVGAVIAVCEDAAWRDRLLRIQHQLFNLGAVLANAGDPAAVPTVGEGEIKSLEDWIDEACDEVPALTQFILPGGNELSCRLHLARTVCRRAERGVVHLAQQDTVPPGAIVYLNRLNDLMFAWARLANWRAGVAETVWRSGST